MNPNELVRIAVDAMSGDGGSAVSLEACRLALTRDPQLRLLLVGDSERLADTMTAWPDGVRNRIDLLTAGSTLPADAGPAIALRRGADSSMGVCLSLVADGSAEAAVSAGSTGALMVLARHLLGMLPGIDRPALMAALPTASGTAWMLDLGANLEVDARRLCEFARLGHVAVSALNGRPPAIGLLNIGVEPNKGPDRVREAGRRIEAIEGLDYRGFVEADQVFAGTVDLVVCDGFSGNVLLKSAEGAVRMMFGELRTAFAGSLCGLMARSRLRRLHDSLDPARHNGAPMLGVRGTVIKSHGGASASGLAHAVGLAALEARRGLVAALEKQLWAQD